MHCIERVEKEINNNNKELKEKSIIKIYWNDNYNYYYNNSLVCLDDNVDEIIDIINHNKNKILNEFSYIIDDYNNSVNVMENIIKIKEEFIKNYYLEWNFQQICMLYKKIIEILSKINNREYKNYSLKFQNFLKKYENKNE